MEEDPVLRSQYSARSGGIVSARSTWEIQWVPRRQRGEEREDGRLMHFFNRGSLDY